MKTGRTRISTRITDWQPGQERVLYPGSTYGSAKATISNFTVGKTPLFTQ